MIETKKVELHGSLSNDKCEKYIQDLTAFGWQPTQIVDERYSRYTRHYQILARETSMPNYDILIKYEKMYEDAKSNIKTYESMDISLAIFLFLIFIFPGIIYVHYKRNQKSNIEYDNDQCYEEMKKAVLLAKELNR